MFHASAAAALQQRGAPPRDRSRLTELTGDTARPVSSPRGKSLSLMVLPGSPTVSVAALGPEVAITYNSSLPYSLNDGVMWAGRGHNVTAGAGAAAILGWRATTLRIAIAPAISYSQNLPFQVLPNEVPGRSAYASPFYPPGASADLPLRFGDRSLLAIDAGRSEISVTTRNVVAGVTAQNDWWGPAIRNTLVLSDNARGIPRIFVCTAAPKRTAVGAVEAKLIAGTLTESPFFDLNSGNDYRALSGLRLAVRPGFDSTLTFGLARVVYTTVPLSLSGTLTHALDALTRWEYVASQADTTAAGRLTQRSDQILSAFARWVFPASGFEVYGEWARMDLPRSATELLVAGHHTSGYTLGLQWARRHGAVSHLRLQSEVTYLEQSRVFPDRPPPDFYGGRATDQGYTQRGQPIGAAIGPGGSSQWIAIDYLSRDWQAGWFAGRVRWNNDALYRKPGSNFFSHDVTVLTGARGGWRTGASEFSAEVTFGYRFNYLFQFRAHDPGSLSNIDVRNLTVSLKATPR